MGRLKYVFLPFVLMSIFAQPIAAPAVDAAPAQYVSECVAAPPQDKCENCKEKRRHARGFDEAAAQRVYSLMTGKSVEDIKKACEAGKLTIWQLSQRDGKLEALKANILDAYSTGFGSLVKSGVMTQEQKEKILSRMRDEIGKQQ